MISLNSLTSDAADSHSPERMLEASLPQWAERLSSKEDEMIRKWYKKSAALA